MTKARCATFATPLRAIRASRCVRLSLAALLCICLWGCPASIKAILNRGEAGTKTGKDVSNKANAPQDKPREQPKTVDTRERKTSNDQGPRPAVKDSKSMPALMSSTPDDAAAGSPTASAGNAGDPSAESFRKHDHRKYAEKIRNEARALANGDSKVHFARLCLDGSTDQWTLTLYERAEKTYSSVSYVWDEIDQEWKRVFGSAAAPLTGWKRHLAMTSARKECETLKGKEYE